MPASGEATSLWRPLRTPILRNLLIADTLSDVGTFMQNVGAAWLMVSLGASPLLVALTQTASTLPFFLFALPAGSLGDIVDRRKLILSTETWMVCAAAVLAVTTLTGVITPILLLALTFALSAGDAFETPTWRAVLPELVAREDIPAASALNGIEFNIARAIGPALAGLLIAAAGVGAAFLVNTASFVGVILVVARWKRPVRKRTAPAETLRGATVAAIRYVSNVPEIRAVVLRAAVVMFGASAIFALLPSVAHRISNSAGGYGVLLGCFGAGAVAGAVVMQRARARWSTEVVASMAVGVLGATMLAVGRVHALPGLMLVLLVGGGAWLTFISIVSALVQSLAPEWVRARVMAIFLLVSQGGLAAGSALWGTIGSRSSLDTAFLLAGIGTIASTALGLVAKLPGTARDVSPWNHWRMPDVVPSQAPALDQGPVLVTVEYHVAEPNVAAFLEAMQGYELVRRRDGASSWGIFRDVEKADVYLESFLVSSWAEHLRQHERGTRGDSELEQRLIGFAAGESLVRHFVHIADE
jgi:MFS family permease